jgi:hypothetical protein
MRQRIFWLLSGSILGLATPGWAQQLSAAPVKGSNIVWAHTSSPADSVLNQLKQYLQQRGFTVDTLSQAPSLLTTKVVLPATSRAGEMKIRAVQVGPAWKLTGIYVVPAFKSGVAYPAEFIGAEMMPAKSAFRIVEAAARAVSTQPLGYDKGKVKFSAFTSMEEALKSVW